MGIAFAFRWKRERYKVKKSFVSSLECISFCDGLTFHFKSSEIRRKGHLIWVILKYTATRTYEDYSDDTHPVIVNLIVCWSNLCDGQMFSSHFNSTDRGRPCIQEQEEVEEEEGWKGGVERGRGGGVVGARVKM